MYSGQCCVERLFCVVRPMPSLGLGSHGFASSCAANQFHRRGWRALEFTSHVPWDSAEHERLQAGTNFGARLLTS